jgi:predicted thioredoxin/glutaredoxin
MPIKIYTSKNCPPCQELEEKLKESELKDEVELVDIESDEGFLDFKKEVLDHDDGAVPTAFKNGKQCKIGYDAEDRLIIECPESDEEESKDDLPSTETGL